MDKPNPISIDRPPRIQPELPFDEIDIPSPPDKEEGGYARLIQVALPLLTIIGYILISTLGGTGRSPLLLIPMALSVVASTAFSIYTYISEKKRRAEIERAYSDRLVELNKEMQQQHDQQRRFYRYNYPNSLSIFQIVENTRQEATVLEASERTLRSKSRLWERRFSDKDFGVVRLGIGTLPSTVTYVLSEADTFEDPQMREAMKLATDSQYVSEIPVVIALRASASNQSEEGDSGDKNQEAVRTPIVHALGIAGERLSVYEYIRAMLSHLLVFHAPMDTRLFVLATDKQEWGWVQELPHCQGDEQNQFFCFVEDSPQQEKVQKFDEEEESDVGQFLEGIRKQLAQRKLRMQDKDQNESKGDPTHPFLVVVADLLETTYDSQSPLHDLESDPAISILLEEGAILGAAVIFLVPERSKVPSNCQAVIEIEKTTPATNSRQAGYQKLHFRYAEVGVNTFRYIGNADSVEKTDLMQGLAERLTEMEIRQSYGANLSNSVSFMELMGYDSLQALDGSVRSKWSGSIESGGNADWLRAKLGKIAGNKPRSLAFSAKRDGVHGLVAGSTGSGKSELLISLITSMAVTYDPTILNFVLVDYKGGGAFQAFERLPHCVDVITNLEGDGVTRMFTAINAEIKRRQALNTQTGTKDIVEYREKNLHREKEPYPHLFIIIDEFAEMIADRSEYKQELESITRVGRAQGVSLILAAQRPSGVTDQMRSNIKWRICLRVESGGESREMLRRTDAAFLPNGFPGRGYLQVGNDEIELMQVAYTGEMYSDPHQTPIPVIWPDRWTEAKKKQIQGSEPDELYKMVIDRLKQIAEERGVLQQGAPWPGPLPKTLGLSSRLAFHSSYITPPSADSLNQDEGRHKPITSLRYLDDLPVMSLGKEPESILMLNPAINQWLNDTGEWIEPLDWERYAMHPVVGLIDNPHSGKQLPLVVNLTRGHVVIFGSSGWGKTTFLRTLITSLSATHSPHHLHIYILDLGGRNLNALKALPHVGTVILPDEEGYRERIEQLLREMDNLIEDRKLLWEEADVSDIYAYNSKYPEKSLHVVLIAIDNFIEFRETFENTKDNVESILDKFVLLARQGKPYGIHFVVSANRLDVLPSQLLSLFTERLTLKLSDPTEYRAIVGGHVEEINDVPGRGYLKQEGRPLSFQIALPTVSERKTGEELSYVAEDLNRLAEQMNEFIKQHQYTYKEPLTIDALPTDILLRTILERQNPNLVHDNNFFKQLKVITQQRWQNSLAAEKADWLNVTIGALSGNRLREMSLEAKKDGVHGMVAGGTGAGKSELLMTLIVGLALNYDPTVLNLVLVDYKGGGAFAPFEALPHCVDIVTNLNKAAVKRMFTSINAEMQRRQRLNKETNTKDIVDYRQKGFHHSREPYPHLFIIIDEYAEMITDSPEFRADLESITRVGRAQGVNLLLASQRPTGVSDQMRANIKFRICLRVEGEDTSREMLRRSDAAYLPSVPGRGYLQVGNEHIELIQVAWTGESYEDIELLEGEKAPTFYEIAVNLAQELLQGERPLTPWPPFLPKAISMSKPLIDSYVNHEDKADLTHNRTKKLTLNPFIADWLAGQGEWHGIHWGKYAMRAVIGLLDDPYNAQQRPLLLDLTKGHAVVFGASGWGKTTFMRSLITSLAATHSPNEFHAHILDLGGRNLNVLEKLPHVGTVIMPDEPGYEERVQQLWRELNNLINERKQLFGTADVSTLYEYNRKATTKTQPAILVIIDNFAEYLESFGNAQKEDENNLLEAFIRLARQGKAYGFHFVISANRLNELSNKLYNLFTERFTFRLADATEYSSIVGSSLGEVEEVKGRGYTKVGGRALAFQVALMPGTVPDEEEGGAQGGEEGTVREEAEQIRLLGENMQTALTHQPYAKPLRIGALPTSSLYSQVMAGDFGIQKDDAFLAQLKAAIAKRWQHNESREAADWLQVILGIASGDRPRTLQMEAKKDGVHGMIAGGTGSGKSELLMTMIVGLALNYSPEILNLVLVDYKGGGAFQPFQKLPHCVDIVTNLNKAAVNRMFTAINAEIKRRQKLNVDTKTKDIVHYRENGHHLTKEPYPHLFIIIDEYAEMIDDNPEYRAELESITRVGRAQGVNLILASQRPKGVSDQMRANIKFRICLRVEQIDTSREMLRRPDAALLPSGLPGRGYLQVGNENIELIQVSYAGEDQADAVNLPMLQPEDAQEPTAEIGEDVPKFYDAVVALSRELRQGKATPKPWPNFLPEQFSLESTLYDAQNTRSFTLTTEVADWRRGDTEKLWQGINWQEQAMRPVIGLVDEPANANQEPLPFDLKRTHLAIFGDSGWGKTSLLRTLLMSLAVTHSPNELQAYILDLGGRGFRMMEALPHVGAVLYADEESYEERLQRLLEKLNQSLNSRQQLLSEAGANTLYAYNQQHPTKSLPAILVIVDNFAELQENYESLVESSLLPLIRRALSVGITFVVTGNIPNNIPSKLYNLFGERVTFKQANPDRYMDIVGRGSIELDEIPGRGYIRAGRETLLFHAALPVGIFTPEEEDSPSEGEVIESIAQTMWATMQRRQFQWREKPDPIQILPELVPLQTMLDAATAPRPQYVQAVLGQNQRLQPALIDLKRLGPHFSVVGPPLSGKTTALYSYLFSLTERYGPEQVAFVLIDTQRKLMDYGGQHMLNELPHVLSAVSEVEELPTLIEHLNEEGAALASKSIEREFFVFIDNFDDFSGEIEKDLRVQKELSALARRHGGDGLHFIICGTLDGTANDLRRRVQSSNYGIGLRSAQAVESLRVMRTPAALRGRELPVGRGYIVRSGQPTMIQIATPYGTMGVNEVGEEEDMEAIVAAGLDEWVVRIQKKYRGQEAKWASGAPSSATQNGAVSQADPQTQKILSLLRRGIQDELNNPPRNKEYRPVAPQFFALEPTDWHHQEKIMGLLQEVGFNKLRRQGKKDGDINLEFGLLGGDQELLLEKLEHLIDGLEDSV